MSLDITNGEFEVLLADDIRFSVVMVFATELILVFAGLLLVSVSTMSLIHVTVDKKNEHAPLLLMQYTLQDKNSQQLSK